MTSRRIEFGYNPPTGQRGIEQVNPRSFLPDLQNVLDLACQHFSSIWISDHHQMGERFRLECWTQLTWIAARYPGPKLGTVVMSNSYRHPPLLAKMAASLQYFSQGRFILGYGAGWHEEEYHSYGFEFPSAKVRIAQMVEGIKVMRALWTERPANFQGEYYKVKDAYCEPRPEPVPPVLIGGDGEKYLLRAVAEHADWWLPYSRRLDLLKQKTEILKDHCRAVGRDYDSIRKTYTLTVYLSEDRAAAERRAGAATERENPVFAGDPEGLRDYLEARIELGFDLFQLVFPDFPETTDIRLFADKVLPYFR